MSGEFEDLHVCGYELRHDDPELRDTLADFRADRGRRIWAMADRLEELGFVLDRAELHAREAAGAPLGRPHLADAVLAHPGNAAKLRAEGIDGKDTLFPPYLVPGAVAYVARSRPTVEEAIDVIHAAGGVAVWAHPFWDIADPETGARGDRPLRGRRARRRRGLLRDPRRGADALLYEARASAGCSPPARPTSTVPSTSRFSRFGAFELYGLEPVLGPIAA